jgi:uncharacterized protein (TIGR03437 family)
MKHGGWILFLSMFAQAQTSYLTFPTGVAPSGITAVDINGDGKPDLVVANSGSNSLTILLSDGTGGFTATEPLVFGQFGAAFAGLTPSVLLAGDLNGDHKIDLIVSSLTGIAIGNGAPVGLVALLGNGDGTFQSPIPIAGCLEPTALKAVDVNGDGVPDLEATCLNGGGIVPTGAYLLVLPGNGDGTFGSGTAYDLRLTPWAVLTVGDFNGDGKPDLAAVTGQTLFVFLNDGKANFKMISTPGEPWNFAPGIAAGDFNGDGVLDLVVSGQSGAFAANGLVQVLLGAGDGTFRTGSMFPTTMPGLIAAVDLNGDGHMDLAEGLSTAVTFFAGRGDGTFEGGIPIAGSGNAGIFALADFTGAGVFGVAAINDAVNSDGVETTGSIAILPRVVWPMLGLANVSAAGFDLGPMSPGSIATVFGTNLATGIAQAAGAPVATLGGVSVVVTDSVGVGRAAPLFYVSPAQVNYIIPTGTVTGVATVAITAGGEASASGPIEIASPAPRLFVVNADNLAAANVLDVAQNGSRTFENIYQTDANGNVTALPIDLGSAPETVFLTLYGTGIGIRDPSEVTVTIAGASAMVTYAGPQGVQVGVDQINVQLSSALASPSPRTVSVEVMVDGQPSNQVTLSIQ